MLEIITPIKYRDSNRVSATALKFNFMNKSTQAAYFSWLHFSLATSDTARLQLPHGYFAPPCNTPKMDM